MTRAALVGLSVAGLAAAVAGHTLGSQPEAGAADGPLASCPAGVRNCALVRRDLVGRPDDVRDATLAAVRAHRRLWTGRADTVEPTPDGLRAVFVVGPFEDDVAAAVVPAGERRATLCIRSASRTGRGDLGVNRRRVDALLAEIERRLIQA